MTAGWEEQMHAVDVITRVRERLEEEGADAELFRLRRFSSDELAILVRLELGLEDGGMFVFRGRPYKNARVALPIMENKDNVGKKGREVATVRRRSRRSGPDSPQGRRETVAA